MSRSFDFSITLLALECPSQLCRRPGGDRQRVDLALHQPFKSSIDHPMTRELRLTFEAPSNDGNVVMSPAGRT